jgi:hypothetical protein
MNRNKLNPEQQKTQMLHLMNFRGETNESKNTPKLGTVEHAKLGSNDKTYAIIKENAKFYIKVAPKKDNIVLEDYEYLGGSQRYKNLYEYASYNHAFKIFEEYMVNLNKTYSIPLVEEKKQNEYQEFMTESSISMKNEIERQRQIMMNVGKIMNEDTGMTSHKLNHPGDPESNGKAGEPKKEGDPFVETKDNDFKEEPEISKSDISIEKAGKPFDKGVAGEKAESYKDVKDLGKASQGTSIATQSPKGGVAVKVNEGKLNELNIDDESLLTDDGEIYDIVIDDEGEGDEISLDADLFSDTVAGEGGEEVEEEPFELDSELDKEDVELDKEDIELDKELIDKLTNIEEKIAELTDLMNGDASVADEQIPPVDDEEPFEVEECNDPWTQKAAGSIREGRGAYLVNEDGIVLHDFGKHPGYRKKPFTTPSNNSKTEKQSADSKDWNDSSVEGEQPFGQKIGTGDPFEEKVKMITDAIMAECIAKGIFKEHKKKV